MYTEEPWFLYIVRCRDGSLYVGISNNVEERVRRHNNGAGAKFTAGRRPVELVYIEEHPNQRLARSKEAQIKKWRRKKKEQLIEGFPRLRSG